MSLSGSISTLRLRHLSDHCDKQTPGGSYTGHVTQGAVIASGGVNYKQILSYSSPLSLSPPPHLHTLSSYSEWEEWWILFVILRSKVCTPTIWINMATTSHHASLQTSEQRISLFSLSMPHILSCQLLSVSSTVSGQKGVSTIMSYYNVFACFL